MFIWVKQFVHKWEIAETPSVYCLPVQSEIPPTYNNHRSMANGAGHYAIQIELSGTVEINNFD